MRPLLSLVVLTLVSGCARYEYQLTQPPDLAVHVGTKSDAVVARDPLEYRLRTVDNLLVMRVFNRADAPVQMLGDQSTVVDPRGQSHPLRNQGIAPQRFIKLFFPPPRPRYYQPGPTFGFGVGTVIGCRRVQRDVLLDEPPGGAVYLMSDGGDGAYYWDWDGEGEIRLDLAYQSGDRNWRDEFTIRRVKMK
jgi:hypothetical protein